MSRTRVLVADDSALIRSAIKDVLEESGDFEVVGEAASGIETLMMARRTEPEIISLDVEMPRIDGLGVLTRLMRSQPTKVVLVSSHTAIGADVTLEGLSLGALDFVPKAAVGEPFDHFAGRLLHVFRTVQFASAPKATSIDHEEVVVPVAGGLRPPAVVGLAASTGGPDALNRFLAAFTERPPFPLLIVQHMPATFTNRLASRLDRVGPVTVMEAGEGMQLEAGVAFVAPGGRHLVVSDGAVAFDGRAEIGGLKPRADLLFESLADDYGSDTLGVVMTGMGNDGAAGAQKIKERGGQILIQDAQSSVVYGMPKRVRDAGLSDGEAGPGHLASMIESTWSTSAAASGRIR